MRIVPLCLIFAVTIACLAPDPSFAQKLSTPDELKSSLAQARAEAGENTLPMAAPVAASMQPNAGIMPPVLPQVKPLAALTASSVQQVAATADSDIGALLFDENNVLQPVAQMQKPQTASGFASPPPIPSMPDPAPVMPIQQRPLYTAADIRWSAPPVAAQPNFIPAAISPSSVMPLALPTPAATTSTSSAPMQASLPETDSATVIPVHPLPTHSHVNFHPAAVAANGEWQTKPMTMANAAQNYCLMQNHFANDTMLMIAESADGNSTLGINFGIDMLQPNKTYSATVDVDDAFEEDFLAYAQSPRTLIVQMGKKGSFFSSLFNAEALHVKMPGAASTFAMQGIAPSLKQFSACITQLGGPPLIAQVQAPAAAAALPSAIAVPVEPVASVPLNAPLDSPMPKTVSSSVMPSPIAGQGAPIQGQVETAPIDTPTTQVTPTIIWSDEVRHLLTTANVGAQPNFVTADKTGSWSDGTVSGTVAYTASQDIIDAASNALDHAQKQCKGTFDGQMGAPDARNGETILPMESKCTSDDGVVVTVWFARQNEAGTSVWSLAADRDKRGAAFKLRDRLLALLHHSTAS